MPLTREQLDEMQKYAIESRRVLRTMNPDQYKVAMKLRTDVLLLTKYLIEGE